MSYKNLEKSKINKILVITLSNIGDVVLTFPVIDVLREEFPEASLSVVVGPKGKSLFKGNTQLDEIFVFDKRQSWIKTVKLVLSLRREKYDMVIDLRNTAIPFLVGAKFKTSPFTKIDQTQHMRDKHLARLKTVINFDSLADSKYALHIDQEDEDYITNVLKQETIDLDSFVTIAPGAADHRKRWNTDGFAEVCDELIQKYGLRIIFIGDDTNDRSTIHEIIKKMNNDALNLSGRTTLTQLAALIQRSRLIVTNDSAPMHLASYFNIPVLALFGPTDSRKYGPWSKLSCLLHKKAASESMSKSNDEHNHLDNITSQDVLGAIKINEHEVLFNQ